MGLDQYAFAIQKQQWDGKLTDPEIPETVKLEELHYWRKHPNLHGWMEALYFARGGKGQEQGMFGTTFNCNKLVLTTADLDRLEEAIKGEELPDTSGFFFGEDDGTERDDDLAFIAKARQAIADGKVVMYDSWW